MACRTRDVVLGSLQRKGFSMKEGGDHFRFVFISQQGKKTSVYTKVSRGTKYKVISDNLLAQMAYQCKLAKTEFLDLIDCPLSKEEYIGKLRAHGIDV